MSKRGSTFLNLQNIRKKKLSSHVQEITNTVHLHVCLQELTINTSLQQQQQHMSTDVTIPCYQRSLTDHHQGEFKPLLHILPVDLIG